MTYPCGTIYRDIEQGSNEWLNLRKDYITSSNLNKVMSKGRGGAESTGYANYKAELAAVRMGGSLPEGFKNEYMERGNRDEQAAADCYSFIYGVELEKVSFITHPSIPLYGSSPDRLVGDDGMIEIKRKIPALHQDYMLAGKVPAEYIKQMQSQMSCAGRLWNDFVSYCPEMTEEYQLFVCRLYRDDDLIAEIDKSVIAFNDAINQRIQALQELKR